jgi:hypothetical protein
MTEILDWTPADLRIGAINAAARVREAPIGTPDTAVDHLNDTSFLGSYDRLVHPGGYASSLILGIGFCLLAAVCLWLVWRLVINQGMNQLTRSLYWGLVSIVLQVLLMAAMWVRLSDH